MGSDRFANAIKNALTFMPNELKVIILSMIPFIELRGSAPIAISMGMPIWEVILLCSFGSSIISPVILILLKPILNFLKKYKFFNKIALFLEELFQEKANKIQKNNIENTNEKHKFKKELISLFLFVSVPIPLTGVWSGSAIAVFMNLPFFKSLIVIVLGNLVAATLMTLLSFFLKKYIDFIIIGLFIFVLIVVCTLIYRGIKKNKKDKNI